MAAAAVAAVRPIPQQMQLMGMQRMQNANMAAFNLGAQASMSGLNHNNLPLQRGSSQQQAHQQVRRKEPNSGFPNPGYPPQPKSRRL